MAASLAPMRNGVTTRHVAGDRRSPLGLGGAPSRAGTEVQRAGPTCRPVWRTEEDAGGDAATPSRAGTNDQTTGPTCRPGATSGVVCWDYETEECVAEQTKRRRRGDAGPTGEAEVKPAGPTCRPAGEAEADPGVLGASSDESGGLGVKSALPGGEPIRNKKDWLWATHAVSPSAK